MQNAGLSVSFGQTFNSLVVQTEVQDGVHHAGHGSASAGTNGHQQRVLWIAELLADDLFRSWPDCS